MNPQVLYHPTQHRIVYHTTVSSNIALMHDVTYTLTFQHRFLKGATSRGYGYFYQLELRRKISNKFDLGTL